MSGRWPTPSAAGGTTARHGVFARAYFLQTVLGLPAGEALEEALKQRHGVTREHLATRPKLLARIEKLNATTVKWGFDATQQEPADRYPLTGVSGRDSKPLYREIDTIVTAKCREVSPELSLLSQVMNESTAPLVVMLAGDEELAFLPGASAGRRVRPGGGTGVAEHGRRATRVPGDPGEGGVAHPVDGDRRGRGRGRSPVA